MKRACQRRCNLAGIIEEEEKGRAVKGIRPFLVGGGLGAAPNPACSRSQGPGAGSPMRADRAGRQGGGGISGDAIASRGAARSWS